MAFWATVKSACRDLMSLRKYGITEAGAAELRDARVKEIQEAMRDNSESKKTQSAGTDLLWELESWKDDLAYAFRSLESHPNNFFDQFYMTPFRDKVDYYKHIGTREIVDVDITMTISTDPFESDTELRCFKRFTSTKEAHALCESIKALTV